MGRKTSGKIFAPKGERDFNRGSEDQEERIGSTPKGVLKRSR